MDWYIIKKFTLWYNYKTQKALKARKWGRVVRLEIDHDCNPTIEKILINALKVKKDEIFHIRGPLNLGFLLREIYPMKGFDSERFKNFEPRIPKELGHGISMFSAIMKLLRHFMMLPEQEYR